MPRRASTDDDDEDAISSARRIVEQATGAPLVPPKNPHAVALSKLGASKGGVARAAKLGARRKKEIARKAARARWGTKK
jgi:hypothetical protein